MQKLISSILLFAEKNAKAVIAVTILITIFFGYMVTKVEIHADIEELIPAEEEIVHLMEKYDSRGTTVDYIVVTVKSPDLFTLESLNRFHDLIIEIEQLDNIRASLNPFNFLAFSSDNGRISISTTSPDGVPPRTEEELQHFTESIRNNTFAERFVLSQQQDTLAVYFPADIIDEYLSFMDEFHGIIDKYRTSFEIHFTGTMPFNAATNDYMVKDLTRFVSVAAVLVFIFFFLGFRAPRAVILPVIVVFMGVVWSIGFMGILKFPITIISMITPPLILALGSSYTIHILNQYYREKNRAEKDTHWVAHLVAHVNKTIIFASVTTVGGLLSLLFISTPQGKEFAVTASFGIFACALISMFFLTAVLSLLPPPGEKHRQLVRKGLISRMMLKLGPKIFKFRFFILGFFIVLIPLFIIAFNFMKYETNYIQYFPQDDQNIVDMREIAEGFGSFVQINVNLQAPDDEPNYFLNPVVLRKISEFEEYIQQDPSVCYTTSFTTYLKEMSRLTSGKAEIPEKRPMILLLEKYLRIAASYPETADMFSLIASEDFSSLTLSFRLYEPETNEMPAIATFNRLMNIIENNTILDDSIKIEVWGNSLKFMALSQVLERDQKTTLLAAVIIILVIALFAFRSVPYALYSLIPLFTGIMMNYSIMYLFKIPFDMATVAVSSVVIGVGIDDSIHFLLQFRRQLEKQQTDIVKVITQTLLVTGRPILLTTLSILAGLLVLIFASFKPIMYFGMLVSLALGTAALGTVIVLPAFLIFHLRIRKTFSSK